MKRILISITVFVLVGCQDKQTLCTPEAMKGKELWTQCLTDHDESCVELHEMLISGKVFWSQIRECQ